MLIDWFTVGAQAANFLILVWLLKRFLYQPVLAAIATREKLVADQLQEAAAKKTEAEREREDFQRRNAEFDRQRSALLNEAKEAAGAERQKMIDAARRDAEGLRLQLEESARGEREELNHEIVRRTRQEVFTITRKALAELASASLEESLCQVFIRRLLELDPSRKEKFAGPLRAASEPLSVRSAFELGAAQKEAIQEAIRKVFDAGIPVRFAVAPDLVCGVELVAHGQKMAWGMTDYLASLEQITAEMIDARK